MTNTNERPAIRRAAIPATLLLALHGNSVRAEAAAATTDKPTAACVKELGPAVSEAAAARGQVKNATKDSSWFSPDSDTSSNAMKALDEKMRALAATPVVKAQANVPPPAANTAAVAEETVREAVTEAAMAVEHGTRDMAILHGMWTSLGKPNRATADFLAARRRIADCADLVLADLMANAKIPGAMAAEKPENVATAANVEIARRDYVYLAHEQNYDEAQLTVFTGPTLALNGDDKFRTGYEVSALFDGGAGSFMGRGRTFADFSYQTKGSVDVAAEDDGSLPQPGANELFRKDKGYLRFNIGASTGIGATNRYSIFTSGGLSTIPGIGGDFPQALRPRYAVGMLGRVFISEGFYTRLSMSVAHDEYWRTATGSTPETLRMINSYERGVIEAVVLIPKLSASGVTLAGRLGLDTPLDGKGPSEVRLSVLASVNFGDFLQKIIKLPTAPTN